jgi:uncharacterized membrane protein YheB (UPF0754 family)
MVKMLGLILFSIVHGYFAAWLAVWMLFYPRRPIFWGTFQIPFTPGLIPSSRGGLENAIADAVTQKLLLPEVIEESAIRQGLPKMIRQSLPAHVEDLSEDEAFLSNLSSVAAEMVKEYLRSNNGLKKDLSSTAMVPFGKRAFFSVDSIFSSLWKHVELGIERVCSSDRFKIALKEGVRKVASDLHQDTSASSTQVEQVAGKMLGSAVGALDLRKIIIDRLSSFSNEQLEDLVHSAAGHHLRSIKHVAALIGVLFGFLSVLLFH